MQSKISAKNLKLAAVGATTLTLSAALAWYLYRRSSNNNGKNGNNDEDQHSSKNDSQDKSLESSQARAGAASSVNSKSGEGSSGQSSRTVNSKHLNEKDAFFRSGIIKNNVSYQLYILAAKGDKYYGIVGIEFILDEAGKNS